MSKFREPLTTLVMPHARGGSRVVLSGDVHGEANRMSSTMSAAVRHETDKVVVLGDFGYWEHRPDGVKYLNALEKLATRHDVVVYFIDGNHDNHPLLWERYCGLNAKYDSDGFVLVRPHVRYIERGSRWTWGATTFLGLGGAPSADKDWRLELENGVGFDEFGRKRKPRGSGTLWWPTEEIRSQDVARAGTAPADVMLTHDAPSGFDVPVRKLHPGGSEHRALVRSVVNDVRPSYLFHGHWHVRHQTTLRIPEVVKIMGLAHEKQDLHKALVVLEI